MAGDLNARGWLLDTHVWIWFITGSETAFSKDMLRRLNAAAARDALLVSDISLWEVATKSASGTLTVTPTLDDWLARAGRVPGIAYLPLDRETLLLSTRLPGAVHRDPADRILLAAAALHSLTLVTADRELLAYGERTQGFSLINAQ